MAVDCECCLSASWIKERDEDVVLSVRVQPGARRTEVSGVLGDELKFRIASPPVEGAANAALIEFVADLLSVRRSQIEVMQGFHSRSKVLKIKGIAKNAVQLIIENSYPK